MTGGRDRTSGVDPVAFGERFAAGQAVGMCGLAVFCWMTVVENGRPFPLVAVAVVLLLSLGFRWRAALEGSAPRRTVEDERDVRIVAIGDRLFRICATVLATAFALAFAVPSLRGLLLAEALRPAGVLLTGLALVHGVGHAAVWHAYARDRR